MNKIGFIGTGIMGKPMVINLISAGYGLNIFARHPEKIKELEGMGARLFLTIAGMVADSLLIITMLPDSLGVSLPLTSFMGEVLKSLKSGGYSESDHGVIIKFFEKISNMDI